MKIDDFMDALNDVDPNYIAESAIELNEKHLGEIIAFRKKKEARKKRIYGTCISAAACLLVVFVAAQNGFLRQTSRSTSDSSYQHSISAGSSEQNEDASYVDTIPEETGEAVDEENYSEHFDNRTENEAIQEDSAFEEAMEDAEEEIAIESHDTPQNSITSGSLDGNSLETDQMGEIVWNQADFVDSFQAELVEKVPDISFDKHVLYREASRYACDVTSLTKSYVADTEVIFAYDEDGDIRYAYYEKEGTYYLVSGENWDETGFYERIMKLLSR